MARNLTDGGGDGSSVGNPDGGDTGGSVDDDPEPDTTDTSSTDTTATSSDIPDDIQQSGPGPGDSPSGGGSVDDSGSGSDDGSDSGSSGSSSSPPDDIQQSGPGPGDSPSGGGSVDDDDDDGSSDTSSGGSSSPPDDIQQSGPGPGDSPSGGGNVDQTEDEQPADTDTSQPFPDDVQNEGPAGTEPDEPDYRAGPGRNPGETTDSESAGESNEYGSEVERRYVQARDYLTSSDVVTTMRDGEERLRLTASGAAARFAANNEGVDEEDVVATNNADGGFDIEYTEEFLREQLEENYSRGPTGAGEQISGEQGISDEGSPNDPLEGTGLEAGFGATADAARDIEQRVTDDSAGSAGGVQDAGAGGPSITDDDVEVTIGEDGTLTVGRARDTLTAEQAQNIDDGSAPTRVPQGRQSTSGLQQQTSSSVTPDTETAAANMLERRVQQTLDERGIGRDEVNVDTEFEDGEVRATVTRTDEEQFGDFAVRLPTSRDQDNFAEEVVETALGATFGPLSGASADVAGNVADAAGVGGARVENVLGDLSEEYMGTVERTSETGGEITEDAFASTILGPSFTRQTASDIADTGVALADTQTGGAASEITDEYSESVYTGAASIGDVAGTVVGVKEGSEFVGYTASETVQGRGGEVIADSYDAADTAVARFVSTAKENPVGTYGTLSGALAASTIGMGGASGVSSRAGQAARWTIQPGEELLSATGIPRASTVARSVPDGARRARTRISESDFLSDTRAQGQLPRGQRIDSSSSDGDTTADLLGEEATDRLRRAERSEVARQAQEQAEFEVEQEYGDVVRDTLPQVDDTTTRQTRAADDIQAGSQRGGNPRVASGEDISFEENFNRRIRETRRESYFEEAEFSERLESGRDSGISSRYQEQEFTTPRQDLREQLGVEERSVTPDMRVGSDLETSPEAAVRSVEADAAGGFDGFTMSESVSQEQGSDLLDRAMGSEQQLGSEGILDGVSDSELEATQEAEATVDQEIEQEQTLDLTQETDQTLRFDEPSGTEFELSTETEASRETRTEGRFEFESRSETASERTELAMQEDEEDEESWLSGSTTVDEVFDTGVVQSLDEL